MVLSDVKWQPSPMNAMVSYVEITASLNIQTLNSPLAL